MSSGPQDDNENTDQANILFSLTFEVSQKHAFSYKTFAATIAETFRRQTVLDRGKYRCRACL